MAVGGEVATYWNKGAVLGLGFYDYVAAGYGNDNLLLSSIKGWRICKCFADEVCIISLESWACPRSILNQTLEANLDASLSALSHHQTLSSYRALLYTANCKSPLGILSACDAPRIPTPLHQRFCDHDTPQSLVPQPTT